MCPQKSSRIEECRTANVFNAVITSAQFNSQVGCIDSGASKHLIPNRQWLKKECVQTAEMSEIVIANNLRFAAECKGSWHIITKVKNRCYNIIVKVVLYVPQLTTNLLSVSQLKMAIKFFSTNLDVIFTLRKMN